MPVKRNYFTKHKTYIPPVPRELKRVKTTRKTSTTAVPERVYHLLTRVAEDEWMRPPWMLEEILDWFFTLADKLSWNFLDDGKTIGSIYKIMIKTEVRNRAAFKAETLGVKKRLYNEMAIRFYVKEFRKDLNWRN